jgi:CTP synthase (UTP-ammonia lyase)
MTARIALVGDRAIPLALQDAGERAKRELAWDWVPTPRLANGAAASALAEFHAIWCVPGSPYASTESALAAIRFAREQRRPFLGTCGGFQHALMEFARSHWGIAQPTHAELEPDASDAIITPLACSLVGEQGEIVLAPDSRMARAYGAARAVETYHCRYGLNVSHAAKLESGPLRVSARDANGEIRAVELTAHPFFVATFSPSAPR